MAKKATKPARNAVSLVALPGEASSRTVARCLLDPATGAAGTLNRIYERTSTEGNIDGYIAELQQQARAANAGDLSRPEATLIAQAHTLDSLFHTLTGWALTNAGKGNAAYFETCMRLAFKAQSQSRATIETLAAIKNPPVVYTRQANFAAGHQQVVNNGGEPSRIREIETPPTKLLEADHGERLDTGAASATGGANQELATVGAVNRSSNNRG